MTVLSLVLVLLTLTFAFFHFRETGERPKPGNVTGVVIEKVFTPAPEQQITYGSKGLKEEQIAGGYVLRVRVKAENRTYDVPVDKRFYEARSVGDPLTFMLPASEGQ